MIRKAIILLLMFAMAACSPELIPRPITPGPTLPPPTGTPVALNAPVVTSPGLAKIAMLDEENGWGLSDTTVLRTLDSGATWYNLTPANASKFDFFASSFIDTQHAWVLAPDPNDMLKGTLFRTSDGGVTWSNSPVPFGGGDLNFLDAKNGWMMASLGAGAGSMGVAILQTNDGGATWNQTYTNDPNVQGAGSSLPLGGLKDGLSPIDMQVAFVGGVTYAPGKIYLYQTQDGGANWTLVNVPIPTGYEQAQFETRGPLFVGSTAYLPVSVSSQNGVMMAVYVSHDAGKTWAQTPTLIPQGGQMDFVTDKDGFVWNGTSFYVTHDGAQTWATVNPDVAFAESFAGMDFVSKTAGFVITSDASGAHGLYKTTDGGATWNVLGK